MSWLKKKQKPRGMMLRDVAGRAGNGIPRASPHPAPSDASAAPLVPHPCFTAKKRHLSGQDIYKLDYIDGNCKGIDNTV